MFDWRGRELRNSRERAEVAADRITLLASGLIGLLPFARGLALGRCFFFRDLARYFFPTRHFYTEGLRQGELWLWNPFVHEGFSDLPMLFYPFDLLQLIRNDEWMYSLLLALHVALAAVGMCALGRSLGSGRTAALGGGILYSFSGYGLSLLNLDIALRAYAWAPLIVLSMRRAAAGRKRDVAVAALTSAVALSTLSAEIVAQGLLAGIVLSVWPLSVGRLKRLSAALILAVGLASTPLLLQARLIPGSARGSFLPTGTSLEESVRPIVWLQLVAANLFGDLSLVGFDWWGGKHFDRGYPYVLSLYLGATALSLALAGAVAGCWMRKRLLLGLALGVLLCMGGVIGLDTGLDIVPLSRLFRYPVKAFFTVQLSLTLMAMAGLDALARNKRSAWRALSVTGSGTGVALILAGTPWIVRLGTAQGWFRGFFPDGMAVVAQEARSSLILRDAAVGGAMALMVSLVGLSVLSGRLRPPLGAALAGGMLAADLLRTGSGLNPMVTSDYYELSKPAARLYAAIEKEGGRVFSCDILSQPAYAAARFASRSRSESYVFAALMESATPHTGVRFGIRTALSLDLFSLVPVERTLDAAALACTSLDPLREVLRLAGVTHVVSADALARPWLLPVTMLLPERVAPLRLHAYRLQDPLPRLELARSVHLARSREEARTMVGRLGGEPGAVVVEADGPWQATPGQVQLLEESPGNLRLAAEAQGRSLLVVRDGFDSGWHAAVNGMSAPVLRANDRHMAVPVPAGHSIVALRHRPWEVRLGLVLTMLSATAVATLLGRRT